MPGTQLQIAPPRTLGYELAPATALQVPWVAVQIAGESACPTPPTAGICSRRFRTLSCCRAGCGSCGEHEQQLAARADERPTRKWPRSACPKRPRRRALPICRSSRCPPAATSDLFAVFLSGDGGWAGIDKNVAAALAARGISVAGVDSLRYFWTARTPQGLAADLDRILRYYAFHWQKKQRPPHRLLARRRRAAICHQPPAASHARRVVARGAARDSMSARISNFTSQLGRRTATRGLAVRPEIDKLSDTGGALHLWR